MSMAVAKSLLKSVARRFLPEQALSLAWVRRDPASWLPQHLPERAIKLPETRAHREFEKIAAAINRRGAQPLWDGYRDAYRKDATVPWANAAMMRTPDQVRTHPHMGRLFAWLAEQRRPRLIVEIGTAFGVSAMYWASGLQRAGGGRLLTFDPNAVWRDIAAAHLSAFGPMVEIVPGTFEDKIDAHLRGQKISLAFVDAIHTQEFVTAQIGILLTRMEPNGIIVLDDISFSDGMRGCWTQWSGDRRVRASVVVDDRVGILEF